MEMVVMMMEMMKTMAMMMTMMLAMLTGRHCSRSDILLTTKSAPNSEHDWASCG